MTEYTQLGEVQKRFILHWGEMGGRWGINRTVAQVHALLLISARPLSAEEIAGSLSVARSNVSTTLRELQAWGLIRPVHALGERRQQYEPVRDVWEMFRIIMDERKRREIDPTLEVLQSCLSELRERSPGDENTRKRLEELHSFFREMEALYDDVRRLSPPVLRSLAKTRGKLSKLLAGKRPRGQERS